MRRANFTIVEENDERICLQDLGPWDRYLSITNDAEEVVRQLAGRLRGRRLEYLDSDGELTRLVVEDGKFVGFSIPG